ncbi:MAG: hypothetical protein IJB98_01900 [Clostridia bacterium]|nr:hypothetical protein [Clostridia bacterium]
MICFMNFFTKKEGEEYMDAEKKAREICIRKKALLEAAEKEIYDGKAKAGFSYFLTCVESMQADSLYNKLYIKGIKAAINEAMSSASNHSVTGTYDARQIAQSAEEVYEPYSELCSQIEENKDELLKKITQYVNDGKTEEDRIRTYQSLVDAYKTHVNLCEEAKGFRDEKVTRFAATCEQYIEDLKLLDCVDEDDDDDEPEA